MHTLQQQQNFTQLFKIGEVLEMTGIPKSTLYKRISLGLFPRPIKISPRQPRWPSGDIQSIIAASCAEQTDDKIKELVARIHEARAQKRLAAA